MIKKIALLSFCAILLILTACMKNSAIVMPFEATFHKYIYTLTKDLTEIDTNKSENEDFCTLLENSNYSIILNQDTLAFYNKNTQKYYDTFGIESDEIPQTGLNISIKENNGNEIKYINDKYYNSESDTYINTFTAYKLNDSSIRLLIVTGVNEFKIIGKTPLVLPESYIKANPLLTEFYSNNDYFKTTIISEYPLLPERLDLNKNLYYLTKEIPEKTFSNLGLTKNTAREVALAMNYDFNKVKMILTTVDITLTDSEIIFDISPNRQYRSELIRDKSFEHNIFKFDLNFVKITESESEKITNAQSKY